MELLGEHESVPDPDDPSVLLSPPATTSPRAGNAFFAEHYNYSVGGGSPSRDPRQQQHQEPPQSPDDEQQSMNLISLGSPDEQPILEYDPFAGPNTNANNGSPDFPQDEFCRQRNPHQEHDDDDDDYYEEEGGEDSSKHYRPPPAVRTLDPLYTGGQHSSPPNQQHYDPNNINDYIGEEKKMGIDEHLQRSFLYDPQHVAAGHDDDDGLKSGEEDFIPIKREGYRLNEVAAPSPHSVSSDNSSSHQSAAFRSAQELLRKNRRKRQEQQQQL